MYSFVRKVSHSDRISRLEKNLNFLWNIICLIINVEPRYDAGSLSLCLKHQINSTLLQVVGLKWITHFSIRIYPTLSTHSSLPLDHLLSCRNLISKKYALQRIISLCVLNFHRLRLNILLKLNYYHQRLIQFFMTKMGKYLLITLWYKRLQQTFR